MENRLKDGVINVGDVLDWQRERAGILGLEELKKKGRTEKIKIIVEAVYPNVVQCRELCYPYSVVTLDYGLLYTKGLLKPSDFRREFATHGEEF